MLVSEGQYRCICILQVYQVVMCGQLSEKLFLKSKQLYLLHYRRQYILTIGQSIILEQFGSYDFV